jgi:nitrite reductase/ring-hydroxylating ferredoxin subunit
MITKIQQLKQVNKKFHLLSLPFLLGLLCFSKCERVPEKRNPYLVDIRFQREINLSLPLYNDLNFIGGSVRIEDVGINGIIVFNLNGSSYLAWEATCPNHLPENCSKLSIDGVLAQCNCENFQYSLATGQILNPTEALDPPHNLLFYQIQNFNGILRVSN